MSSEINCTELIFADVGYDYDTLPDYVLPLALTMTIVYYTYFICTWLLFVYYKYRYNQYARFRERSLFFTTVVTMGCMFHSTTGAYREYVGRPNFPCVIYIPAVVVLIPLIASPVVIRLFQLYYQHEAYKQYSDIQNANNIVKFNPRRPSHLVTGLLMSSPGGSRHTKGVQPEKLSSLSELSNSSGTSSAKGTKITHNFARLTKTAVRSSTAFNLVLAGVVFFPFIVVIGVFVATDPKLQGNCNGCTLGLITMVIFAVSILIVIVTALYGFYKLRGVPDNLGIKEEIRLKLATASVFGLGGVLLTLFDASLGSVEAQGLFTYAYIQTIGLGFFQYYQTIHQIVRFESSRSGYASEAKKQGKVGDKQRSDSFSVSVSVGEVGPKFTEQFLKTFKGREALVTEIANSPELLSIFEEHLAKEFTLENMRFYMEATKYKSTFLDDKDKSVVMARKIYNVYVNSSAIFQINLPSEVKNPLDDLLNKSLKDIDKEAVSAETFDSAIYEIKRLLVNDIMVRFVRDRKSVV